MNSKEKELRSLTWKYFWKRKREEIYYNIKENWVCYISFTWLTSLIISTIYMGFFNQESLIPAYIFFGALVSILSILLIHGIYSLIKNFIEWIQLNWEWATEDARKELNQKRRNK